MAKHILTTSRRQWETDCIDWEYHKELNSRVPARVQDNSRVGTSLRHQLLHQSSIKTVPSFIYAPVTPRSPSFQDGDARRMFILDQRLSLWNYLPDTVKEADTVELFNQKLKTSIWTMLFYPHTVLTLLSALDFGRDHAYGILIIILLIIIIIIIILLLLLLLLL